MGQILQVVNVMDEAMVITLTDGHGRGEPGWQEFVAEVSSILRGATPRAAQQRARRVGIHANYPEHRNLAAVQIGY